ncbi:MAG: metalloregulator ArsR/SmtB family transcription factor [Chloroflexota bacterium]|nr:metalloregulator ArsR/SmtB family transcription factor [Chloroflexota bacterium]
MSKTKSEENLEARANLFKALGHPVRLLILNLVEIKPRHGEELAEILRLNPATISHHLSKLSDAGMLTSHKDQYYQIYSLADDVLHKTIGQMVLFPQTGLSERVQEDAYRVKVLRTFMKHGRLTQIPAQYKKRQIIMEEIVKDFEPERTYTEIEVNRILIEYHEDVAMLRRSLIDYKLMEREKGIYKRV